MSKKKGSVHMVASPSPDCRLHVNRTDGSFRGRLFNYRLDHAITATQKTILGAFGIDEDSARARALSIGKELMGAAAPEQEEDEDGANEVY